MKQIDINTSQNVNISFRLSSVGERLFAFLIDLGIKLLYAVMLFYVVFLYLGLEKYLNNIDSFSSAAIVTIITSPLTFYTLVLESLMGGQTFGKKIMKIKVVKIDGYQASFADFLIRWFFRIIDVYVSSGIFGIVLMISSKNNQRLGDMASGTSVISLKNNVTISHTILENIQLDYMPTYPQVIGLTDNDMRIIKENYQKALAQNDLGILEKLSDKITEILKINYDATQISKKSFIDKIIKDYNYYTGNR